MATKAEDVEILPPVRCMTCGKILRESYYEAIDDMVGKKIQVDDLLIRLYKDLAMIIRNEFNKSGSIEKTAKDLGLSKFYNIVSKKESNRTGGNRTIGSIIENIIFLIEDQVQQLLDEDLDIEEVLETLQLDKLLDESYQNLKNYKYKPEDVFEKLKINKPCCRTSISFAPKIAIPSYIGAVTGYNIEPDKYEPEEEQVIPESPPKDKASKLKALLKKAKERSTSNPQEKSKEGKKQSRYYAI
jgi:DNA-directed RNA polymerase subunit N (RpoN/RPB10)